MVHKPSNDMELQASSILLVDAIQMSPPSAESDMGSKKLWLIFNYMQPHHQYELYAAINENRDTVQIRPGTQIMVKNPRSVSDGYLCAHFIVLV